MAQNENEEDLMWQMEMVNIRRGTTLQFVGGRFLKFIGASHGEYPELNLWGAGKVDASNKVVKPISHALWDRVSQLLKQGVTLTIAGKTIGIVCFYIHTFLHILLMSIHVTFCFFLCVTQTGCYCKSAISSKKEKSITIR